MRIVLAAAAVIASLAIPVLTTPALAQAPDKTPEQLAKEREDRAAAEAYKKSLGIIPDQGPTDPWGNARSTEATKPQAGKPQATKTAKSKAKATETKTTETKATETKPTPAKPQ